ncbi:MULTISPECIES: IS3 family transposase [unclassified Modestobacter]
MIVAFIDAHRDEHDGEPICTVLTEAGAKIAPSGYYAHRPRPPSARSVTDAATTTVIERVHAENFGVFGAWKLHAELHRQGHAVARCTVERLMPVAGLRGITRAKGPRTTVPGTGPDTRPDLVDRAFTATGPDQLWLADITYCRTGLPVILRLVWLRMRAERRLGDLDLPGVHPGAFQRERAPTFIGPGHRSCRTSWWPRSVGCRPPTAPDAM